MNAAPSISVSPMTPTRQSLASPPCSPLVAALFVQSDGCYSKLPTVDAWPESRDARLYNGKLPVVAHPPCSRWSRLARFCEVRHGLKVGADGGCFEAALRAVRANGGVIEHPAFSKAWAHYGLPRPDTKHQGWTAGACGGYSCYIEQGRYGHPVKKATWLYVYGVPLEKLPELRWGHTPDSRGTISQKQDWRGGMDKWRDSTGHRAANATPPEFRDELIRIACMANARRNRARTKGIDMKTDANECSGSRHCYAAGWRPEKALKQTVLDMVATVFDPSSTVDECEMAASTIVEAIYPEVMAKATEDERRLWESA